MKTKLLFLPFFLIFTGNVFAIAPVANDDILHICQFDVFLNISSNDNAAPGTTLDLSSIDLDPSTIGQQTSFNGISVDSNGNISFFTNTISFQYTIRDSNGIESNIANVQGYEIPNASPFDDDFSAIPIDAAIGGYVGDVLSNDLGLLDPVVYSLSPYPAIHLSNTGTLSVDAGVLEAGTYTFDYILTNNVVNACTSGPAYATVTIVVVDTSNNCWKSVATGNVSTFALKTDGTLWGWGYNEYGYFGSGGNQLSPLQIGTDSDWKFLFAGNNHFFGIKNNGTLWAWGWNQYGNLGDGTLINRAFPVQVGSDSDWKTVSASYGHTLALKNNKTLWAWGENLYGAVGNGNNTNQLSPVQITTSANWVSIGTGDEHSMAINSNGFLYAWGENAMGQLGNGTTISQNIPVISGFAPLGNIWKSVSLSVYKSFGILYDGSLWEWGNGQSIPIQIGSDTNWKEVSAAYYHYLALKTDGTLWAWGLNGLGQLGNGTTIDESNPIQIGIDNDWVQVDANFGHSAAVKLDARLFVWGFNNLGQLGNNTTTDSAIPILINCNTTLSINENTAERITIFPNPTQNVITIISANSIKSIDIIDLTGRVVGHMKNDEKNVTISLDNVSKGICFIKVTTDDETTTHKIIRY